MGNLPALLLATPFWIGAYVADGWRGVAIMAIFGVGLELLLRRSELAAAFATWRLRRSVRRRIRRYQAEAARRG